MSQTFNIFAVMTTVFLLSAKANRIDFNLISEQIGIEKKIFLNDSQNQSVGIQIESLENDADLQAQWAGHPIDVWVFPSSTILLKLKWVVFDMDSTLIPIEVMDELSKRAGSDDQVLSITEQAMQGTLDFSESFTRRLATLKGLPAAAAMDLAMNLPLSPGVPYLFSKLKSFGIQTAIVSGGFQLMADALKNRLGADMAISNPLDIKDGLLTGQVAGPIVDAQKKVEIVQSIMHRDDLKRNEMAAVGDGANDIPMLQSVDYGFAYQGKPKVRAATQFHLTHSTLDALLYLIGHGGR